MLLTDFNIDVVLGKLSDCDNMLKEKLDRRKDVQSMQSKMISEEHIHNPRLKAKANEHVTNAINYNKVTLESK